MKRGLILINAYCKLASFVNQAERLKTEFNKLGVEIDVRRNDFFAVRINTEGRLESIVKEYEKIVGFENALSKRTVTRLDYQRQSEKIYYRFQRIFVNRLAFVIAQKSRLIFVPT